MMGTAALPNQQLLIGVTHLTQAGRQTRNETVRGWMTKVSASTALDAAFRSLGEPRCNDSKQGGAPTFHKPTWAMFLYRPGAVCTTAGTANTYCNRIMMGMVTPGPLICC